jgi:hypothetical protein
MAALAASPTPPIPAPAMLDRFPPYRDAVTKPEIYRTS